MTPPNLPRKPLGWPNIRLKTLCIMCIRRLSPQDSFRMRIVRFDPGPSPEIVYHNYL